MEVDGMHAIGGGEEYFQSYEDLEVHKLMLQDAPRNKAYKDAIFSNRNDFCGKVVLDVGAGTGILSVFCAQAGARTVYAVEASNTYHIAEEIAKENKFENVIKVIHSRVEDLLNSHIPEKVDIIVSEWMGFYLFHEGMLNSVIAARDKFLKPDGKMFPESATLYSSPCSIPSLYNEWENVEGISMNSFAKKLREEGTKKPLAQTVSPDDVLADPEIVTWIDLKEVSADDVREINVRHIAVCSKPGNYQGIALWFTCMFPMPSAGDVIEPVTLSTEPEEVPTHWKQTVIVLPTDLTVEIGMPVCYDLALKQGEENGRRYTLEVTMLDPNEIEHPECCSCYLTKCILVKAMLDRYEKGEGNATVE